MRYPPDISRPYNPTVQGNPIDLPLFLDEYLYGGDPVPGCQQCAKADKSRAKAKADSWARFDAATEIRQHASRHR
ncbi:hypothetical protein [Streptomyces sp. NPDC002644]